MAGRVQQLTSAKAGISRLKVKGGADRESLYDLLNGYVDSSGSIVSRPGTVEDATLPSGTHGLMPFDDAMVVFSTAVKTGMPAGYSCEVLVHPTDPAQDIVEIHFSAPFLGYPYVVAEFTSGDVYHYWLQGSGDADSTWQANHIYDLNEVVVPGNGLAYRATRLNAAAPTWKADEPRALADVVEPTVFNKYQYTVTEVAGDNPRSGSVEPNWPASDGAVVYEQVDLGDTSGTDTDTDTPPDTDLPGGIEDRYCVAWDSVLDDGSLAIEARPGDMHWTWTPEAGWTRQAIVAVAEMVRQPCVRITLDDGSVLRCSATTPFTDPAAARDGDGWLAPDMLGKQAFNADRDVCTVVAVEPVGQHWVVPIDFGGRSFAAGDAGLVYSHNIRKVGL